MKTKMRSVEIVKIPSPSSPSSLTSDMSVKNDVIGDDIEKTSSPEIEENHAQNGLGDDSDDSDDICTSPTEDPPFDSSNDVGECDLHNQESANKYMAKYESLKRESEE
jgi:hypothetical protein